MPKGIPTNRTPIAFKIKGTVAVEEIPTHSYTAYYDRVLKAVTSAPAGQAVRLKVRSYEEATKLASRLYAVGHGAMSVRVPKGGTEVFVWIKKTTPVKKTHRKKK